MSDFYDNIVSVGNLERLQDAGHPLTIRDCRAALGDAAWGRQAYAEGHIEGALYANLDEDLAAPPDHRGRHPLPDPAEFCATLGRWGISADQQVVVYDDAGGAYAARAWWMLRWVGHAKVAVLDGGLKHWHRPLVKTSEAPLSTQFQQGAPLAETVAAEEAHAAASLLDARTEERWAGRAEPIDPVAGHIPGAVCLPFQENLDADGLFKSPAELTARFEGLDQPLVCYCGSGVTACHNILALHIAGISDVRLYADSWSGWITDPNRPVATE